MGLLKDLLGWEVLGSPREDQRGQALLLCIPYALWKQWVFPKMSWRENPSPRNSEFQSWNHLCLTLGRIQAERQQVLAEISEDAERWNAPCRVAACDSKSPGMFMTLWEKRRETSVTVQPPCTEGSLLLAQYPSDKSTHALCWVTCSKWNKPVLWKASLQWLKGRHLQWKGRHLLVRDFCDMSPYWWSIKNLWLSRD